MCFSHHPKRRWGWIIFPHNRLGAKLDQSNLLRKGGRDCSWRSTPQRQAPPGTAAGGGTRYGEGGSPCGSLYSSAISRSTASADDAQSQAPVLRLLAAERAECAAKPQRRWPIGAGRHRWGQLKGPCWLSCPVALPPIFLPAGCGRCAAVTALRVALKKAVQGRPACPGKNYNFSH